MTERLAKTGLIGQDEYPEIAAFLRDNTWWVQAIIDRSDDMDPATLARFWLSEDHGLPCLAWRDGLMLETLAWAGPGYMVRNAFVPNRITMDEHDVVRSRINALIERVEQDQHADAVQDRGE